MMLEQMIRSIPKAEPKTPPYFTVTSMVCAACASAGSSAPGRAAAPPAGTIVFSLSLMMQSHRTESIVDI